MDKVYPSKKGFFIYILLLLLAAVEVVYIVTRAYLMGAVMLIIMGCVFFPIYLNTRYTITASGSLKVRSGFFINLTIPVSAIKKITPTKTILSSPALSLDRMEIFYNKFDSVIISPLNKEDFIEQLKIINPSIVLEL